MDELHFGVHQDMMYARNVPAVQGAQWTGIVTQIAIDMLESGQVDAVICVQNDEHDRFKPKPVSHLLAISAMPFHPASDCSQACTLTCFVQMASTMRWLCHLQLHSERWFHYSSACK